MISIVTISFNQAPFLREAIDSVFASGAQELEYILVDPGSTDGSRALIAEAETRGARAILEPDDGPADGLNRGVALSRGEIIGYLNADDRYPVGALTYVERFFAAHTDVDVLFAGIRILDAEGRASLRSRTPDRFKLRGYAEQCCNVWCPSTFFRRSAFDRCGGFNAANRTCWDGELAVDLVLSGARFACRNRILGEFRIYPQSITGSGRLREAYEADRARIRDKIYASGVKAAPAWQASWMRLAYRVNPLRHLQYLLA